MSQFSIDSEPISLNDVNELRNRSDLFEKKMLRIIFGVAAIGISVTYLAEYYKYHSGMIMLAWVVIQICCFIYLLKRGTIHDGACTLLCPSRDADKIIEFEGMCTKDHHINQYKKKLIKLKRGPLLGEYIAAKEWLDNKPARLLTERANQAINTYVEDRSYK